MEPCVGERTVSWQRLGEGLRAAAGALRGPGPRLERGEVRRGRARGGRGGGAARIRCPGLTPARPYPARGRGAGARALPARPTQPLDSARGQSRQPRPAEPPPARPAPQSRSRVPDPRPGIPAGPAEGTSAPPLSGGRTRRADAGLGATGERDGLRRSASGPRGRRPSRPQPPPGPPGLRA